MIEMKIERIYFINSMKNNAQNYKHKRTNKTWRFEYTRKNNPYYLKYFVIIRLNSILNPCRSLIINHDIIVT